MGGHNDFVPSAVFIYVAVSLDSLWLTMLYEPTKSWGVNVGEVCCYKTNVDCGSWKCTLTQKRCVHSDTLVKEMK